MIVIGGSSMRRLELDDRVSVLHGVAPGSHRQHPQVIFIIAKRDNLVIVEVEPTLENR